MNSWKIKKAYKNLKEPPKNKQVEFSRLIGRLKSLSTNLRSVIQPIYEEYEREYHKQEMKKLEAYFKRGEV